MTAPRDDGSPWPPPSGGQQDPEATWLAPTPPPPSYPSGPTYPPSSPGGYPPSPPSYGPPGTEPYGAATPEYPSIPYPAPAPPPPSYPGAGYPGYAGAPAPVPPIDPYYSSPSSINNGLAIASLATSIAGVPLLFACLIGVPLAIAAIVMGIVALNQIKQTQQQGRGMAIAGIVIGAVTLAIPLLIYLIGLTYTPSYSDY